MIMVYHDAFIIVHLKFIFFVTRFFMKLICTNNKLDL